MATRAVKLLVCYWIINACLGLHVQKVNVQEPDEHVEPEEEEPVQKVDVQEPDEHVEAEEEEPDVGPDEELFPDEEVPERDFMKECHVLAKAKFPERFFQGGLRAGAQVKGIKTNRTGIVLSLDAAGDPKVKFDDEAEAKLMYAKHFSVVNASQPLCDVGEGVVDMEKVKADPVRCLRESLGEATANLCAHCNYGIEEDGNVSIDGNASTVVACLPHYHRMAHLAHRLSEGDGKEELNVLRAAADSMVDATGEKFCGVDCFELHYKPKFLAMPSGAKLMDIDMDGKVGSDEFVTFMLLINTILNVKPEAILAHKDWSLEEMTEYPQDDYVAFLTDPGVDSE